MNSLKRNRPSQFERSVDERIVEAPDETLRNSGMNVSAVAVAFARHRLQS
jgi:hypothetical protein